MPRIYYQSKKIKELQIFNLQSEFIFGTDYSHRMVSYTNFNVMKLTP